MASIGHVAVGMAAARLHAGPVSTRRLSMSMVLWSALSMLPDADVIGLAFGVRYGAAWGHRGATHSFAFSIAVGMLLGLLAARFGGAAKRGDAAGADRSVSPRSFAWSALLTCVVLSSHALLDTLTDGGRGCALFWPFSDARHFAPLRPIPVAPIGLGFLSERGLRVALVELVMFAPVFAYALWPRRSTRGSR